MQAPEPTRRQYAKTICELTGLRQISTIVNGRCLLRAIAEESVARGARVLVVRDEGGPYSVDGARVVPRVGVYAWYDREDCDAYDVIVYDCMDVGVVGLQALVRFATNRGRVYVTGRVASSNDTVWRAATHVFEVREGGLGAIVLDGRELSSPASVATELAGDSASRSASVDLPSSMWEMDAPPPPAGGVKKGELAHVRSRAHRDAGPLDDTILKEMTPMPIPHKTFRPESLRYELFSVHWKKWTVAQQAHAIATLARLFPIAEVTANAAGLVLYVKVPGDASLDVIEKRIRDAAERLIRAAYVKGAG